MGPENPAEPRHWTVEEYLALDDASDVRLEFVSDPAPDPIGEADRRARIIHNLHGALWTRLRGSRFQVRSGPIRLRSGGGRIDLADVAIINGSPDYEQAGGAAIALTNPAILFDISADSADSHDRGRQFNRYRKIESVAGYLLISAQRASVEAFSRGDSGTWLLRPINDLADSATLAEISVELPLTEIFDGIEFPPELPPAPRVMEI